MFDTPTYIALSATLPKALATPLPPHVTFSKSITELSKLSSLLVSIQPKNDISVTN